VSSIRQARAEESVGVRVAFLRACDIWFRAIVVSPIVAKSGLPAVLSHSIATEIQPPPRVVTGGLLASTPPILIVLPASTRWYTDALTARRTFAPRKET